MLTVASPHAVTRKRVLESHFSSCTQEKWRADAELQSGRKIVKSTWQQPDYWFLATSCYPVVSLPGHRRNCPAICIEIRPYSYRCEITAIVLSHTNSEYLLSECDSSSCCEDAKKNRTFSFIVATFLLQVLRQKSSTSCSNQSHCGKKPTLAQRVAPMHDALAFTIIMWVHSEIWLAASIFWLWN